MGFRNRKRAGDVDKRLKGDLTKGLYRRMRAIISDYCPMCEVLYCTAGAFFFFFFLPHHIRRELMFFSGVSLECAKVFDEMWYSAFMNSLSINAAQVNIT